MTTPRLHPWMLVSAAWIGPALLALVSRLAQSRLSGEPAPPVAQLLFESLDWLIYGFFAPLIFAISRRWPLARTGALRHWAIHIAAAIAFCAAWAAAGTLLKLLLGTDRFEQGIGMSFASWFFTTLPFGTGAYLGMVGIEHAIRHYTAARDWEARAARAAEQLVTARLAALQARLNPHFLFNSLNTVAVLVREGDSYRAASVLEQLSDVLRRTLATHDAPLVALGEELFLVRQYLAVEQARFSDRLRTEFDISDALLTAAVPCFALQHLVENAVRHGISRRSGAGRIAVSARRDGDLLTLTVIDDGAGFDPPAADAAGHGLDNTRARLQALYGDQASLVVERVANGGTVATLRIPYTETAFDPGALDDA